VTPAGVTTTNDWAYVIDLGADCVTYFANSIGREREAIADLVPFLERGTNVVTFSGFEIAHPAGAPRRSSAASTSASARNLASSRCW